MRSPYIEVWERHTEIWCLSLSHVYIYKITFRYTARVQDHLCPLLQEVCVYDKSSSTRGLCIWVYFFKRSEYTTTLTVYKWHKWSYSTLIYTIDLGYKITSTRNVILYKITFRYTVKVSSWGLPYGSRQWVMSLWVMSLYEWVREGYRTGVVSESCLCESQRDMTHEYALY